MPIQILYDSEIKPRSITLTSDRAFVLCFDKWDDFGYRTMFRAYLVESSNWIFIGHLRIITDLEKTPTSDLLSNAPKSKAGGHAFLLERPFLSLGDGRDYYESFAAAIPDRELREELLENLHDVVYLEHRGKMIPDLDLRQTDVFRVSMLRSETETRVYGGDARQILFANELRPERFNFRLTFQNPHFSNPHVIDFRFDSDYIRPTNVMVLIGKNGLGKTYALNQLVDHLLRVRTGDSNNAMHLLCTPLFPIISFKNVIAISYSPFEYFPPVSAKEATPRYTYCGFRTPQKVWGGTEHAWKQAWQSLLEILRHDQLPLRQKKRPKFSALLKMLSDGLGFDSFAVGLRANAIIPNSLSGCIINGPNGYIVNVVNAEDADPSSLLVLLEDHSIPESLHFYSRNQGLKRFSAGQEIFVYMAFGIISSVEQDSLVIIDEPELYLHPNLLVVYLRMLNTILRMFEAYAVIATHSTFVAREFPARNVRVFSEGENNSVSVDTPSVETFGADLSDIANLVFDNIAVEKPFELMLKGLIGHERDFEVIREKYGKLLNAESLTYVRNAIEGLKSRESEGLIQ